MTERVRRSPQDARAAILAAAEALLIDGGLAAVQMRAIAHRLGVTDAAVAHHFGNRDGLLVALLRHGGLRVHRAVDEAVRAWAGDRTSVGDLVERIAAVYADGYGELAVALHGAGWRDEGSGMLDAVVDALHAARTRRPGRRLRRRDTQLAVAALHQALATEPSYGAAFRRSAGLEDSGDARDQLRWWSATLTAALDIPPG